MLGHKAIGVIDSSRGGAEVVVEELSTRMAALGHEVTCYNRSNCDKGRQSSYKGVILKRVFTIDRKGFAALTSSFIAALKSAVGDFDIVHFHAEGSCFWMWIPYVFKKKCVATIHGIDWKREKWETSLGAWCIRCGEKMAVRFADEIIVLSKDMQEYFLATYGRKTVFIPNGANLPVARDAEMIIRQFSLKKNDYILFLGRLVPEKGLRYLVEAYEKLDTDKKLVIAGAGSDTEDLVRELQERAAGDDRVIFTGYVAGQMKEELYSNAYIYVLPSDLEGMSLGLLEAMSYGNCCVVSDIAECVEVVEDHAVTFRKGNVEALSEKMQMLCDDPAMVARYKKDASSFVCGKYNWDDVVKKTLDLYENIL
ncbi:MAG: glycosyltransferase family 4 protein [Lachnospiraceae bacterium]|nr:glycosyltransferase family 4 protein [Lachnospiraceae bacterium]